MNDNYAIEVLEHEEEDLKEKIMPLTGYDKKDKVLFEHRTELMAKRKKKLVDVQQAISKLQEQEEVVAEGVFVTTPSGGLPAIIGKKGLSIALHQVEQNLKNIKSGTEVKLIIQSKESK